MASGLPNEAVLMSPRFTSSSRRFSEKRKIRDGSPRVPQNFSSCGDDGTLGDSVLCSLGSGVGCCLAGIRVLAAFSFLWKDHQERISTDTLVARGGERP